MRVIRSAALAIVGVAAASTTGLGDPATRGKVADAETVCGAESCTIFVTDASPTRFCVKNLRRTLKKPGPRLIAPSGIAIPLKWVDARVGWCAVITPSEGLALDDRARSRPISFVPRDALQDANPAVRGDWTLIGPVSGPDKVAGGRNVAIDVSQYFEATTAKTLAVEGVGGQLVEPRAAPTTVGEPVEPASPVPSDPHATPDDRAYLDVVAVGAGTPHCTGVAIAPDVVLTAAHCLPATEVSLAIATTRLLHTARVTTSEVHPALDVAILRLATPLPVVLRPRRTARDARPPRGLVRMIGFGVDDPRTGGGFGTKRRADVPVSSWGCDAGRSASTGCEPAAEMVIAAVGGRDTCWGDSGGPVLEPFGDTWRLIALTSRPTLHAGAMCGRGGIYVRLDAIDAWLQAAMKEHP